jgi:hypothetical protein
MAHLLGFRRPLSEPSVLKKKFDEIFSATKYVEPSLSCVCTYMDALS